MKRRIRHTQVVPHKPKPRYPGCFQCGSPAVTETSVKMVCTTCGFEWAHPLEGNGDGKHPGYGPQVTKPHPEAETAHGRRGTTLDENARKRSASPTDKWNW